MSAAIKLSAVAMMLSVGIVSALPATRHGRVMVGPPRPAVPEGVPARMHQTLHPHAAMCLRGGGGVSEGVGRGGAERGKEGERRGGGGQPLEPPTYYDSLLGTAKVGNLPISY